VRVLSRQQLFDMAWERPLTKVAAELGVTSTALKKTCRRHNIPTPSRGYWAAVAAGGVFPKPKLSPVSRSELETVRVVGAAPMSPAVKEAADAARKRLERPAPKAAPAPAPVPVAEDKAAASEVRPELAATAKALAKAAAKAKPGETVSLRGRGVVPMTLSPSLGPRALAWLARLLQAAQGQGMTLQASEVGAHMLIDGEAIAFRIEEKLAQTPHVPTAAERALKARGEAWRTYLRDPWPKYDYSPSGALSILINPDGWTRLRCAYADGKTQTLESLTDEIVVGFAAHAAATRERRLAAAESARQAAEAEARRARLAAYNRREEQREAFASLVAAKLSEREKLARVLVHVEAGGEGAMPQGMGVWLRRRLAELDALLSARFMEISARHAKVEFDEAAAAAKPPEPSWYYPRGVSLELWSIDEAEGRATSLSPLEWAVTQGLIPPPADPPASL